MTEYRRYVESAVQSPISHSDSQRITRNAANKLSRSKDKMRLHCVKLKENFLTDTQTSDYTKSSNECGPSPNIQILNQTIKCLRRQNQDLKEQIFQLKSNSYFNINEDKLKDLIAENDKLKSQFTRVKKQLDESVIERDFLQRFNKNLKNQCEQLTREVLKLSKESGTKLQGQRSPKNTNRNIQFQQNGSKKIDRFSVNYLEEIYKPRNPHRSQETEQKLVSKSRQPSKSRPKQHQKVFKKSTSSSRPLQSQYFIGKGTREDTKKHKKSKRQDDQ